MGVPANDERLQKGVAWLKCNQRESGMWFTRSPSKDSRNYFFNIGTDGANATWSIVTEGW